MFPKLQINKNSLVITYKILNDLFFLELVFFFIASIAEGILPGIISDHIGFPKIILAVMVNLLAIYFVGKLAGINLPLQKTNKKTASFTLLILLLLVFNSFLKLSILLNLFLVIVVAATGYYLYRIILED